MKSKKNEKEEEIKKIEMLICGEEKKNQHGNIILADLSSDDCIRKMVSIRYYNKYKDTMFISDYNIALENYKKNLFKKETKKRLRI